MDLCWQSNVSAFFVCVSLLFNSLSSLVITFLPRSKCLLISWLQSLSAVILEPKKIKSKNIKPGLQQVTEGNSSWVKILLRMLNTICWFMWNISSHPTAWLRECLLRSETKHFMQRKQKVGSGVMIERATIWNFRYNGTRGELRFHRTDC